MDDHMLAIHCDAERALEGRVHRASQRWNLTRRQTEVLAHILHGRSNKEIANHLGCAEGTVEIHVTHLLRRARADGRGVLMARFWLERL